MAYELHCGDSETDEAIAAAARALRLESGTRRPERTLLLAELEEDEADALREAAADAGLPTVVTVAPRHVELRKAEPLLLLTVLGWYAIVLLGARFTRQGIAFVSDFGFGQLVIWALIAALLVLLYRRFAAADVVPLWHRRPEVGRPLPIDLSAGTLQAGAALAGAHAALCIALFFRPNGFALAVPLQVWLAVAFDVLAAGACAALWKVLEAGGGATGAARYLPMLIAVFGVDIALTLLASANGLAAFPSYTVPLLHLGALIVGYPLLRGLVFGLLFLALGYGMRRVARPTPYTRLLAGTAVATGLVNAVASTWVALVPLALFDLALALLLLDAAQRARPAASSPATPRPRRSAPAASAAGRA